MNLPIHSDPVARQVLRVDDLRLSAVVEGDTKSLAHLLLDDLVDTHSAGGRDSKQRYLAGIAGGKVNCLTATRTEVTAQIYGDACILSGLRELQARVEGQARSFATLFQRVWIQRSGTWAMAVWASALSPAAATAE